LDRKTDEDIEIECPVDFRNFWSFVKNKIPQNKIDFSLNVRNLCQVLGLYDNKNIYCGRLDQLLFDAGIQYYKTLEPLMFVNTKFTMDNYAESINEYKKIKKNCILLFSSKSTEDPRCLDIKETIISSNVR